MKPAENKYVVEAFKINSVCNVTWIWEVHCRFYIDTKDLQNLRVCVKLSLDKPEHIELFVPYKQIPTDNIGTDDVFDNNNKDINEGIHYFQILPNIMGN